MINHKMKAILMGFSGAGKTGAIAEVVKSDKCEKLIVLDLDDKFSLFASAIIDQKYHSKIKIITPNVFSNKTDKYHKITEFLYRPTHDFEGNKLEFGSRTLFVIDTISAYKDYVEAYYRKLRHEKPVSVGLKDPIPYDLPYSWRDWGTTRQFFNAFLEFSRDFNNHLIVNSHIKSDNKIDDEQEKKKVEEGLLPAEKGMIYPSMVTLNQSKEVGKYFDAIWWVGRNSRNDHVFIHKSQDLYNKLSYNAQLKSLWLKVPGLLPAFRDASTGKLSITSLAIEDIPKHEAGVRQLWDEMQSLNK